MILLYNGFPHPELSRTYGLSVEHQLLRETYMPHIRYLLKRYERLKALIGQDETTLIRMATLFLHASDTPAELRPMKQRVRQNVPGTDIPFPSGPLVDTFEQDTTFLEILEELIVQLRYPPILFLHAIYVYYEYICKEWLASHPRVAFQVKHLKFAGKSLPDFRGEILEECQEPTSASTGEESSGSQLGFDDQYKPEAEDLMMLKPLFADPDEQHAVNSSLDKQSGILGLIGKLILFSNFVNGHFL